VQERAARDLVVQVEVEQLGVGTTEDLLDALPVLRSAGLDKLLVRILDKGTLRLCFQGGRCILKERR